ncbi:unnamed protein product [Phaedon cochleariae]|uniref:Major facilitator superfamily (MFS) profile domain-containing protein n=1 Tax=Phaedon cochleariae TaxID=80249 RepID=A0A9N9SJX6_PHACE|nr:unnamed protein product [Phaedon cochleariae]
MSKTTCMVVVAGLGMGLVYMPAVIAVGFYFERRRGVATGLASCGSGLARVALPILLTIAQDSVESGVYVKLARAFRYVKLARAFRYVWKTFDKYPTISLDLHDDPVEDLLFSPNMEPILVSLGEQIAWWNLKSFLETKKKRGRPKSIDILDNLSCDLRSMNISLWGDRQPLPGCSHLLACIKLNGKAKYVSASNDFNSFLTIDDNGKVYIMEIVHPDS